MHLRSPPQIAHQVLGGSRVLLINRTLLEGNVAPDGLGSSIYLSSTASLVYRLPAPPGRWLNVRKGVTYQLDPGAEDLAFPYACTPGVVGGALVEQQMGPGCSRPW